MERIDPTLAPYDILTMTERRALTTWEQTLFGKSFAAFGAIALLLALCGIYGVIAYTVARQTREIGIRIALGARPGKVRTRVVGRALALAGAGVALGLLVALGFARALRGIVFGVDTNDPWVFLGAGAVLLAAAALAGWLPARRAARVDPTEALRAE
jgi:ABC-type antimicrobial peptide transport system permease subunit